MRVVPQRLMKSVKNLVGAILVDVGCVVDNIARSASREEGIMPRSRNLIEKAIEISRSLICAYAQHVFWMWIGKMVKVNGSLPKGHQAATESFRWPTNPLS